MKHLEIKGSHSGHSLVAACLDCHPNVVVANIYGYAISDAEVLSSRHNKLKWKRNKYNYNHPLQNSIKSNLLWLGNTGRIKNPDKTIGIIKNPYVMANTLIKKHKTEEAVIRFMDQLFENMNDGRIFYEDLLKEPRYQFTRLADILGIPYISYWVEAAISLIRDDIPQSKMNINLDLLFNKYEWLKIYE